MVRRMNRIKLKRTVLRPLTSELERAAGGRPVIASRIICHSDFCSAIDSECGCNPPVTWLGCPVGSDAC